MPYQSQRQRNGETAPGWPNGHDTPGAARTASRANMVPTDDRTPRMIAAFPNVPTGTAVEYTPPLTSLVRTADRTIAEFSGACYGRPS